MPLYEYKCRKCGETFEVRAKFSDQPLTIHKSCGGEVEQLATSAALRFKGTGWYVTDYGGNGKKAKKDSADKPAKTEAKTETKSEAKPAATPKKD